MTETLHGGSRCGSVRIPASKSQAHRLLILAALGEEEVTLLCDGISADIAATMACLNALGAEITETAEGELRVIPMRAVPEGLSMLPCGESGSTLRFLMPVVGALGANCVFRREGRLPQRPLAPFDEQLISHGMTLREEGAMLYCSGKLQSGSYVLPGDVSSQYISGLLMALPRLQGDSSLTISGKTESAAYITMTEDALRLAGATVERKSDGWQIRGGQSCRLPHRCTVEGDWSSAAFFLCMGALSKEGPVNHPRTGLAHPSVGLINQVAEEQISNAVKQLGNRHQSTHHTHVHTNRVGEVEHHKGGQEGIDHIAGNIAGAVTDLVIPFQISLLSHDIISYSLYSSGTYPLTSSQE